MQYIGVDACKKGWFAVLLDKTNDWETGIFETIGDLWSLCQSNALILIDIPIGLPDSGKRRCDVKARKLLKRRAASVFPVPCRQAVLVDTYKQACRINQKFMGVKLSVQTWNIAAKIHEVDQLLCSDRKAQRCVRESHPEICFWACAGERPMAHYKKTDRGFAERLNLLKRINPVSEKIANSAIKRFQRKDLARDAMGLPMEIAY